MGKNYWMMVASPEDFEVTKQHGFTVYGVRGKYRRRAQRMQPEDRMLFYVKGLRKWTATATITSQFFEDRSPIWNVNGREEVYPFRVKTKPEIVLDEADYIDALMLAPRLEYVKRWAPEDWPLAFFDSLHLIPQKDFRLIEGEMNRFVSPRRNGRRRGGPGNRRDRDQRQDDYQGGNESSDGSKHDGLIVPQPAQIVSPAPVVAPYDEHEIASPASPDSEQTPHTPVDDQPNPASESIPETAAYEPEGQPLTSRVPDSPGVDAIDEHDASPQVGQTDDQVGQADDREARESIVDDHPATDDSSTCSSST